ncbi:hypothetical protein HDV00_005414 [Rhizophlyctis rosea]|nr:hypothetical protein HDV00_005414 [Rhizophlyctis rosea]
MSYLPDIARLARTCTMMFTVAFPALYRLCFDFTNQSKFDDFCELMATSPRAHLYAREVLAIIAIDQECGASSQNVRKLAKLTHGVDADEHGGAMGSVGTRKFQRMQELCFGPSRSKRASPVTDVSLAALLRQCPSLVTIQVDNCPSVKGKCFLRDDIPVHALRQLQLRFCDGLPANLFKIIERYAPTLEELELTHLYPKHLEAIAKSEK